VAHLHSHGATGHAHPPDGRLHPQPGQGHGALALALAITLAYAVVEFLAGWWLGSLALVSDAGHMLSDAGALGLAWFAARLAQRPPGLRHSFGLARAEVIAAFFNGLAMLFVVVLIAVEAFSRLRDPQPVQGIGVMLVAFVGLLINVAVALVLSRSERTLNRRAAMLHVASDMVGSLAALLAGAVIALTGWNPIDPILSLFIALLIVAATVHLLRETLHVLMEGVPRGIRLDDVGNALARIPGVGNVHDLHVWHISSGQVALSAHVLVSTLEGWPQLLEQARTLLLQRYGIAHVTLQPELRGAGHGGQRAVVRVFGRR
jgi:cobalt-zinc-cadmium efflux system protein